MLRTEKFFYNWEGENVGLAPSDQPRAAGSADADRGS